MGLIKDIKDIEPQIQVTWNNPHMSFEAMIAYLSMAISKAYSGRINSKDIHEYIEDLLKEYSTYKDKTEFLKSFNSVEYTWIKTVLDQFFIIFSFNKKTLYSVVSDIIDNIYDILNYMLSLNYINGE